MIIIMLMMIHNVVMKMKKQQSMKRCNANIFVNYDDYLVMMMIMTIMMTMSMTMMMKIMMMMMINA